MSEASAAAASRRRVRHRADRCRDRGEGVPAAAADPAVRVDGRGAARRRGRHAPVLERGARAAPRLPAPAPRVPPPAPRQVRPLSPPLVTAPEHLLPIVFI